MFTKEQLIAQARENASHYADLLERLGKEGDDCKVILEMVELDLELARIALEKLEAEPVNNGWIRCSDRMPMACRDVIIADTDLVCRVAWFNDKNDAWYVTGVGWFSRNQVSHWMQLPELPEE